MEGQWLLQRDVAIERRLVLEETDLYHPERGEK